MIVKKTRRLVARMGQYESHEVVGEVVLDTNNEDDRALVPEYDEDPIGSTAEFLDEALQAIVASDVEEAAFNTADEDSFIHEYAKNNVTNTKKK